ncbi:MAG TPA: hypothetical protein PLZ57_04610 [Pseudobdellovibrionaceae bacterium]|nr:hypothetical protein [Pseudobdellovibrionaceae bacterium]
MSQADLAFENVTDVDEVARVLNEANVRGVAVFASIVAPGGFTRDYEFSIKAVKGSRLVLTPTAASGAPSPSTVPQLLPKEIQPGLELELIFSISTGQYAIRDIIADSSLTTITVNAAKSLLRQQRRRDFRVPIRHGVVQCFLQRVHAVRVAPELPLNLLDLSAGGMKLMWPLEGLPEIKPGAEIAGRLKLSPGREVDFTAKLVALFPATEATPATQADSQTQSVAQSGTPGGFEFDGLKQDEARAILFTCLQLHREIYGR